MTTETIARPPHRSPPTESLDEMLGDLIGLAEAAKLIPPTRPGKRVHTTTLTRWIVDGVAARHPDRKGERIYLGGVCGPGQWMTTRRWISTFLGELTADRSGEPRPPYAPSSSVANRRQAIESADREAEALVG